MRDIPSGVLSQRGVVIVDLTSHGVKDDVLQNGTKPNRVVNVGLLLSGKTNSLGVATTLNVKDTLVTPAVLVVTN